jgi:hypothetical protein
MDNSPDERRPPTPKTQSPSPTQEDGEERACSLIRRESESEGIDDESCVDPSSGVGWLGLAGIMAMVSLAVLLCCGG